MILTYLLLSFNWKLVITVGLTLVLFIAALFGGSPQIRIAVSDYVFKTEINIGDRRGTQIDATISAAKHGGLIGLGYGISDPALVRQNDLIEGTRYYREKMISVLALVEEVGVIGLGFFLTIIGYVFWLLFKTFKKPAPNSFRGQHSTGKWQAAFITAILIALSFNAQIEGWWLGAGSWQFLLFFSLIGSTVGIVSNVSIKV